ncbi:hypothetical protein [Spiroplasma endosymbiont of Virgichneumon dumeticola]|uniref:hypothetical protein n=1 Tax=Spiroplasma endosymbiont of Virgichneumon dumeticola TaxID=3139323 RepID=UPI0035C8AA14
MKKFMSFLTISILINSLVSSTINLTNNTKLGQEIKQNLGRINNPFISEFSNLSDVDVYNSVVASDGTIYVGTDKGFIRQLMEQTLAKWTD